MLYNKKFNTALAIRAKFEEKPNIKKVGALFIVNQEMLPRAIISLCVLLETKEQSSLNNGKLTVMHVSKFILLLENRGLPALQGAQNLEVSSSITQYL